MLEEGLTLEIKQNDTAIGNARKLGIPKMLLLGIQHMFAMFGATVLVPMIVNNYFDGALSIQVTLFFAGIGTLFFHLCTKLKVPAFLGSSFAFLGGFQAVSELSTGKFAAMSAADKLPYAMGGIVVAGAIYLVLALIIKIVGPGRAMRFLPPVVTGPMIICIGLTLAPSAIANAQQNWILAIIAILTVVIFSIWGKGMFKIIPILLGMVVAYIAAIIMEQFFHIDTISFAEVKEAAWLSVPPFELCKFDLSAILIMAPIAIATMMEHIGDISAISATTGKRFVQDPGLHRTLVGDGIATALAGAFGGPANTTYGENTGVLELSKVHDPSVVRIAAYCAVILSFVPKFSAVISTMPMAIIGGVSFILYGMISAIGVRNVVENKVDFTKSRNLIIAASILVCGLGFGSTGITFTVAGTSITLTGLAIAAIVGVLLNAILPGKDFVLEVCENKKDEIAA